MNEYDGLRVVLVSGNVQTFDGRVEAVVDSTGLLTVIGTEVHTYSKYHWAEVHGTPVPLTIN